MKRLSHCLVLASILILSGCGFTPLHSRAYQETLAVDLSSVALTVKGSSASTTGSNAIFHARYNELLKAEIEDGVNPLATSAEKLFEMNIAFTENDIALFVNPDGTASRGDLSYSSYYVLTRKVDGKVIATGTLARVSSYSTSPTADYASYVSIEDARKRGILELAQDYKMRLAALLPTLNSPNASAIAPPPPAAPDTSLQLNHSNETGRTGY